MNKKFILIVMVLLIGLSGFQTKIFALENAEDIILGTYKKFPSVLLGEDVTYFIKLPDNYEKTAGKYPVIYVLNSQMISTVACASATIDRLSFELIPEMILVGISNTGRAGSYMPIAPDGKPGGADDFLHFLTEEFLPFIDRTYRTFDFHILMGQSNTGLFAIYAYLNSPETFNGCIAASPSLGWCLDLMIELARSSFTKTRPPQSFLYMNYGGKDYKDLVNEPVTAFAEMLREEAPKDFQWTLEYLEKDGHVPITSMNNGLLALFPDYFVDDEMREKGLPAVDVHYNELLSQRYGFSIRTPEEVLFNMSYNAKQKKNYDEAIAMFQILLQRYPASIRGYFFLGETYREKGNLGKAEHFYLKALEIDPDFGAAKRRLELLQENKKKKHAEMSIS
jgi:predicted alpha/beta superfamily hydrolase